MASTTRVTPAAFSACGPARGQGGYCIGQPQLPRPDGPAGRLPWRLPCSWRFPVIIPPLTSIWWQIIGLLQKSTSGLGHDSVRGRSRVPKPPTNMSALRPGILACYPCRSGALGAGGARKGDLRPVRDSYGQRESW